MPPPSTPVIDPEVAAPPGADGTGPARRETLAPGALGQDPAIPRRFFWFFDVLGLVVAFFAAHLAAPSVQLLIAPGGPLRLPVLDLLSPPGAEVIGLFRPLGELTWVLLVMTMTTLVSLAGLGGYRPLLAQSRLGIAGRCLLASLVGLSFVTLILFGLRIPRWSRAFVFLFALIGAAALAAYRLAIRSYRRRRLASGFYRKNVVVVGSPAGVREVAGHFARTVPESSHRLVGYLAVNGDHEAADGDGPPRLRAEPPPRLGDVGDLGDLLIHQPIHEVVAVQGEQQPRWLGPVIEHCDYFRVTLRIVPEALLSRRLTDLVNSNRPDALHVPQVVLRPAAVDSDALFVKRLVDIVVSAVLLVLLLPLGILIALAIKVTTPDLPVFYRWRVVGYKGRRFTGYKFTTMQRDADERKAELMHLNEMTGPVFKIARDPRVTRLGVLLRKFSLNELPQLWSVLTGDMSLVGPRPAAPHELERYELWHKRKLSVRPGITCLWQVRGRNRISDFDDWVRMDLEYIETWSLWLDFKILLRTAWVVVAGSGS